MGNYAGEVMQVPAEVIVVVIGKEMLALLKYEFMHLVSISTPNEALEPRESCSVRRVKPLMSATMTAPSKVSMRGASACSPAAGGAEHAVRSAV